MSAMAVVCIGGALLDRTFRLKAGFAAGTSNPATMSVGSGGVARNVAAALARLGVRAALAAAVGRDAAGDRICLELAALGVDVSRVSRMADAPTAEYAAVLDGATGALVGGFSALDAAEVAMDACIGGMIADLPAGALIFADANLSAKALAAVVAAARGGRRRLVLDAVSIAKSARLPRDLAGVGLLVLNADEAAAILGRQASAAALAEGLRARGAACVVVTCGSGGAVLADAEGVVSQSAMPVRVRSVTGAGDSLIAAMLWRMTLGETPRGALRWGVAAAGLATESEAAVPPELTAGFLAAALSRMPPP